MAGVLWMTMCEYVLSLDEGKLGMIPRLLVVADLSRRKTIALTLRRSAEESYRDSDRFLARAYEEAAYSLEEHGRLNGTEVLLACNSLEREKNIVFVGKDDPDETDEDRLLYGRLYREYGEIAAFLQQQTAMQT